MRESGAEKIKVYSKVPESCQEAAQAVQNYQCNLLVLLNHKSQQHVEEHDVVDDDGDEGNTVTAETAMLGVCDELYVEANKAVDNLTTTRKQTDKTSLSPRTENEQELKTDKEEEEKEVTESNRMDGMDEEFVSMLRSDLAALRQKQIEFQYLSVYNRSNPNDVEGSISPSPASGPTITSGLATIAWSSFRGVTCAVSSTATGATSGLISGGIVGGVIGGVNGSVTGVAQGTGIALAGAVSGISSVVQAVKNSNSKLKSQNLIEQTPTLSITTTHSVHDEDGNDEENIDNALENLTSGEEEKVEKKQTGNIIY